MLDIALMTGEIEPKRRCLGDDHAGSDGFDRLDHAATSLQQMVGECDDAPIRRCGRGGAPQRGGDSMLVACGAQCAHRYEGCGRGTTDACVAVHHQRRLTWPTPYKGDKLLHVLSLRCYVAIQRCAD